MAYKRFQFISSSVGTHSSGGSGDASKRGRPLRVLKAPAFQYRAARVSKPPWTSNSILSPIASKLNHKNNCNNKKKNANASQCAHCSAISAILNTPNITIVRGKGRSECKPARENGQRDAAMRGFEADSKHLKG